MNLQDELRKIAGWYLPAHVGLLDPPRVVERPVSILLVRERDGTTHELHPWVVTGGDGTRYTLYLSTRYEEQGGRLWARWGYLRS